MPAERASGDRHHPARPARRVVLAGAGLGLLAGCTGASDGGGASRRPGTRPAAPTRPDPDAALRDAVVADVGRLATAYASADTEAPALRLRLRVLAAEVHQHLSALGGTGSPPPAHRSASPAAAGRTEPAQVLRRLRAAELAAADRRLDDCVAAADPALARLLAAVAACGRTHAALLAL
jgi:hypothetical protein